jgi:hypothetical protein
MKFRMSPNAMVNSTTIQSVEILSVTGQPVRLPTLDVVAMAVIRVLVVDDDPLVRAGSR